MTVRVYIMRHAWAAPPDLFHPEADEHRELTPEGRQRLHRWAAELHRRGIAPQAVLTSPLVRAVQTAQIVAETCSGNASAQVCPELAPGADLACLLRVVADRDVESMLWVGHMPDVAELAQALAQPGSRVCGHFPPAALVVLEFEQAVAPGAGTVVEFLDPDACGV